MAVWNVIDHQEIGSGGAASWTKSSIPASYDHLLLIASVRTEESTYRAYSDFRVGNGGVDTGNNYNSTRFRAASGTPDSASESSVAPFQYNSTSPGTSVLADTFSVCKIWIPNYANTSNYKQLLFEDAVPNNATGVLEWEISLSAGLWASTSAITDVAFYGHSLGSSDLAEYSSFTLYGINGAG